MNRFLPQSHQWNTDAFCDCGDLRLSMLDMYIIFIWFIILNDGALLVQALYGRVPLVLFPSKSSCMCMLFERWRNSRYWLRFSAMGVWPPWDHHGIYWKCCLVSGTGRRDSWDRETEFSGWFKLQQDCVLVHISFAFFLFPSLSHRTDVLQWSSRLDRQVAFGPFLRHWQTPWFCTGRCEI